MHAASREALNSLNNHLDSSFGGDNAVAVFAQLGLELFEVVDLLDNERGLRAALTNPALDAEQRAGVVTKLFDGKVSANTVNLVGEAAKKTWSTNREFRTGLVLVARRALLRAAEAEGKLEQVENELFQLSRLLERESELTSLITDRSASSSARRGLLSNVLYGKVTPFAEALALQVIARPEGHPADAIAALSEQAAELRERSVARVTTAGELSEEQHNQLAEKLGRVFGRAMSVHTEVDPSLLGGMIVRVKDERIDGSISGKLERLRSSMA